MTRIKNFNDFDQYNHIQEKEKTISIPSVLYHGSENPHADFSKMNEPMFFSKQKRVAKYFGDYVYTAHLTIKHPMILPPDGSWYDIDITKIDSITDQIRFDIVKSRFGKLYKSLEDFIQNHDKILNGKGGEGIDITTLAKYVYDNLRDKFDGIIVINTTEGDDEIMQSDDYIVFEPKQIREIK